jgi:RAB6A-GEF complex partner protein 1
MYWPIGAPRIYAASDNRIPKDRALKSGDGANTQQSGDSDHVSAVGTTGEAGSSGVDVGNEDAESTISREEREQNEERSSHLNQPLENSLNLGRPQTPGGSVSGGIIGLRVSRNGLMFATITTDVLTIWQTRVRSLA